MFEIQISTDTHTVLWCLKKKQQLNYDKKVMFSYTLVS